MSWYQLRAVDTDTWDMGKISSNCMFKHVHAKNSNIVCKALVFVVNQTVTHSLILPFKKSVIINNSKQNPLTLIKIMGIVLSFDDLLKESGHGSRIYLCVKISHCNWLEFKYNRISHLGICNGDCICLNTNDRLIEVKSTVNKRPNFGVC